TAAVETVRDRRAGRTAGRVVGPEHEVVDEELRAPSKEVWQRGAAFVGLECVLLVDPDPRQLLPSPRQLVAAPRQLLLRLKQLAPRRKPLFTCPGLVLGHRSSPLLVFDERPQAFGRVVPLRRDLVDVPLCSLQTFSVQVPHPLPPPAGVAYEPHTPEGVEVARNRLTRHPGPFAETSNREGSACGQASQQAESSRVAQRGEQRDRAGGGQLQRGGAALTRHT